MNTRKGPSPYQRLRRALVTPESIYGTLLVGSMIAVADDDEHASTVFFVVVFSAFVFYVAHVFAGTIAHRGSEDERIVPLSDAITHSSWHSLGLLYAAVLPALVLGLGAFRLIDDEASQSAALGVVILVLIVMGWQAMAERGARWYGRLLGSVVSGFLGTFLIVLETVTH